MSMKWVGGSYQCSQKELYEHWRVRDVQQDRLSEEVNKIAELEKENEQLQARFKAIHQRQFRANRKKVDKDITVDTQNKNKKRGPPFYYSCTVDTGKLKRNPSL